MPAIIHFTSPHFLHSNFFYNLSYKSSFNRSSSSRFLSYPSFSKKLVRVMSAETGFKTKLNEMEEMYLRMQKKMFSKVPEITADELHHLINLQKTNIENEGLKIENIEKKNELGHENVEKEDGKKIVVVDVRTKSETDVSMLPATIPRIEFEESIDKFRDHKIICYCTIGFRSGMYAQDLISRGYDAYNLKGSILAWTHGGYDLLNAEGKTNRVHVFDKKYQLQGDGYEPVVFDKPPLFQLAWDFLKLKLPPWVRGAKSHERE